MALPSVTVPGAGTPSDDDRTVGVALVRERASGESDYLTTEQAEQPRQDVAPPLTEALRLPVQIGQGQFIAAVDRPLGRQHGDHGFLGDLLRRLRSPAELFAGVLVGGVFFVALARSVEGWLDPAVSRRRVLAITALRFALLLALLVGSAMAGALPLLTATLGVLAARVLVVRRMAL